jgi:type VI secretion system FHA domain protein
MIVLSVTSYNGGVAEPLEARFDELGGSIGRADGNLLVLPDPLRTVSRVHAHVAFCGGAYTIEDRGSNPIQLNGKVVGRERPWPLAAGDVLRIGSYEIRVREDAPPAPAGAPAIPIDWDPMASATAAQAAATPAPGPAAAAAPPAGSIDEIFGLGAPLAPTDATLSGFIDLTEESSPAPPPAPPTAHDAPRPRAAPVVSWDGGGVRETKVIASGPGASPAAAAPLRPPPPPRESRPADAAPPAGVDALLQGFLDGLGTVDAAPPIARLTPELMRRIGALLGESVRGAVDLLHARAAVKREVRAEVTAIRPQQNNVIKFSPSAAVALQYLLGEPAPGFMGAEASMRDAYDDLRAHELAVMAGMRAALTGLLQRFDPAQLEGRIVARSKLGSLLVGGRRAQLWEAYRELFALLSAEARDDFHEVFGQAFVRAYEEQLLGLQEDSIGAPTTRAGRS